MTNQKIIEQVIAKAGGMRALGPGARHQLSGNPVVEENSCRTRQRHLGDHRHFAGATAP
jgi:hypothetical protein